MMEEYGMGFTGVGPPKDNEVCILYLAIGTGAPPIPKTVARPTTLGACQVRLQLSILLLFITTRANFCAIKFISLVVFEQLKSPKELPPCVVFAWRKPCAARLSASSQVAGRSAPLSRTRGVVRREPLVFI